jgi:hypothetical protein
VIADLLLIDGIEDLRLEQGDIEHCYREINNQQSSTNQQSKITKSSMI